MIGSNRNKSWQIAASINHYRPQVQIAANSGNYNRPQISS
jgi:hypothetical protein